MGSGLKGWVPINVRLRAEKSEVTWVKSTELRLVEPFFDQSVRRITENRRSKIIVTALDAVFELSEELTICDPDGFIFHTSRCGSTLVCNALRSLPQATVVAEAQPISVTLAPFSPYTWPFSPETWERNRNRLVWSMIRAFGQLRTAKSAPFFVKFTSWNTVALHVVRAIWPAVKWVFVYRDPVEVLVSNLRRKPAWLRFQAFPDGAAVLFSLPLEQVKSMSVEEFGARVIAQYYSSAAAMADDRCLMVDHKGLNAGGIRRVLTFLGQLGGELTQSQIDTVLFLYSKDPDRLQPFSDDSEDKQLSASSALRQAVDKWARVPFERLTAVS